MTSRLTALLLALAILFAGCSVDRESKPWQVVVDAETGQTVIWRCDTSLGQFDEAACSVILFR